MNRIRIDHEWKIYRIHLVDHHRIEKLHNLVPGTFLYVDYSKDIRRNVVDTFDLHSMDLTSKEAFQGTVEDDEVVENAQMA